MEKKRCAWALQVGDDGTYHDTVWGLPMHDDRGLFEFLILEGAQAGLSWSTVLKKQESYKQAFDDFDPVKVAAYDEKKVEVLLQNEGIIRNRLKINSAIRNAKVFLEIQKEFGSFDAYIWGYVENKPVNNHIKSMSEIPATTDVLNRTNKLLSEVI